jgi:hypothetical protein
MGTSIYMGIGDVNEDLDAFPLQAAAFKMCLQNAVECAIRIQR